MNNWFFWLHPLRGIAALGVVFLHCYWTWSMYDTIFIRKLYLMVDLFFILSGFVISAGYGHKIGNVSAFKLFVFKRFDRLHVQYFMSGFVWLIAGLASGVLDFSSSTLNAIVYYILFISVFFGNDVIKLNPVSWSVIAEFWVYLSFGVLFCIIRTATVRIVLSALFAVFSCYIIVEATGDLDHVFGNVAFARAILGFYLGSLAFYSISSVVSRWSLMFSLSLTVLMSWSYQNFDLLFIPVFCGSILLIARQPKTKNDSLNNLMKWLGDISYPIYLWHFIVTVVMGKIIASVMSSNEVIILNGEKFIEMKGWQGNLACLAVLICSLILAQLALFLESRYRLWRSLHQAKD